MLHFVRLAFQERNICGSDCAQQLTKILSSDERIFYENSGYIGPHAVMPEYAAVAICHNLRANALKTRTPPVPGFSTYARHLDCRTIYDLCTHNAILDRLEDLYGPDIMLWNSSFWIKTCHDPEIPWHQDAYYWPISPALAATVWIALTHCTKNNGALQLIPGSHRREVPHVVAGPEMLFERMADVRHFDYSTAVTIGMKPGEFIIFNEHLLHRSGKSTCDKPRIALAARFSPSWVNLDQERLPFFPAHRALIVRGRNRSTQNKIGEPPE
jgi:hypothetical protein